MGKSFLRKTATEVGTSLSLLQAVTSSRPLATKLDLSTTKREFGSHDGERR